MNPKTSELTAINLKYSSTAKSLKVLAFASLITKTLFLERKTLTVPQLSKKIAELLSIQSVDETLIQGGINELNLIKKIRKVKGEGWQLNEEVIREIEDEIFSHTQKTERIVINHFPARIEKGKLVAWFLDAAVEFFTAFGEDWVHSVCKNDNKLLKLKPLHQILTKSISTHNLTSDSEVLINGFKQFMSSNDEEDTQYIADLGYSMFSARLVAADVGADPITVEELKNSTFIIDTNFLLALHLEGHRLAKSFQALGSALKYINANIVYIHETKEEYKRVVRGRKGNLVGLFKHYTDTDVIFEAKDDFIETAKMRGCKELAHIETFFRTLDDVPKAIPSGPKIKLLDDSEIKKMSESARKDNPLKGSIQKWYAKFKPAWYPKQKSESQLCHDATLIKVVEHENKEGRKSYILTLDRSFQACAAERSGKHNIPEAIYLEGLIHILAANNAGPGLNAVDFGPLLASMLAKKCSPSPSTYILDDLHWLYSIEKNVANLDKDKIQTILIEVAKARLSGKSHDDPQLVRAVNRFYQAQVRSETSNLANEKEKRLAAERDREEEIEKRQGIEKELTRKELIIQVIWRVPCSLLISAGVYLLTKSALKGQDDLLSIVANVAGLIAPAYFLAWNHTKLFYKKVIKG